MIRAEGSTVDLPWWVVRRSEWRAVPPARAAELDTTPYSRVWLHHTAGPAGGAPAVRAVQRAHLARGWRDIAYSVLVGQDGAVYDGIGVGRRHLNADAGWSATVCAVGNFELDRPTPALESSLARVLAHGYLAGWFRRHAFTGGHRDQTATACPGGHLYARIPAINGQAARLVDELTAPTSPARPADLEDQLMPFVLHDSTTNMHYLATPTALTLRPLTEPLAYMHTADGGQAGFGYRKVSVPHALRSHLDAGWRVVTPS